MSLADEVKIFYMYINKETNILIALFDLTFIQV